MKSLSTVLNLVLLFAVIVLFYLHFSDHSKVNEAVSTLPLANGTVVYVNSDSLLEEYDYYKEKKTEFDEAQSKIKFQLKMESENLQKEIQEYQKNAPMMTDQQRQSSEEQLSFKQQSFLQKKDEMLAKLEADQNKVNDEIYARLDSYMKEFNKKRNYSFVLGYQRGGGILFANDSLNITKEIVAGLNNEYKNDQEEKK